MRAVIDERGLAKSLKWTSSKEAAKKLEGIRKLHADAPTTSGEKVWSATS